MSINTSKNNQMRYLPLNTDFISRDDMIINSFDNSNQTSDYLIKKFKFFRNEKENLKLLKTHSTNLFKNKMNKDKSIEKFNTRSNFNTYNTFYNTNTSSQNFNKYQNTTESEFKIKTNLAKFIEDDFGYKIKNIRENSNLEKCLSTYDINETLPSLFDKSRDIEKFSHRTLHNDKRLNPNFNMLKFYKTKTKNVPILLQSPLRTSPSTKIKKILSTENAEPNKKLFLKNIEFNMVRNKKKMNVDNKNVLTNKSKENTSNYKRLFLNYLNENNINRNNPNDSSPLRVYKSSIKKNN